ncbi:MAG TPA: zf-HC2 domain-containing protein [Terriglobales bacterium]|nr:zf-HC2 domain-containing protein [Terriglobales bacterium]
MCDFSGRLVAWMDCELPDNEAADVERHVRDCSECRGRVDAYEEVSRAFVAYCDAAIGDRTRRRLPRWVPVLLSGAAAAAVLIILFHPLFHPVFHPTAVKQMPVLPRVADAAPAAVVDTETAGTETETAPRPVKKVRRQHVIAPVKTPNVNWASAEPAIQIAIPVEAMFPPGAVPEGITFIADLSISADGSIQGLRLQQ